MHRMKTLLLAACAVGALTLAASGPAAAAPRYQHVLLISVDGMHAVDLQNWIISHPAGALAGLAAHGTIFPNALTTAPSDSFPGMVAQVTGASPRTAGVFYDDSYERTFFAPGSNCAGPAGAETTYAENIDVNQNLESAGGTVGQVLTQIDPAKLPERLVAGKCEPVYPHQFVRANTIFEIIKAAGLRTAWADKHPAYEILNGPSGQGIDDLFTPEVNSLIPGQTGDNTTSYTWVRNNDGVKVKAVVNEINGFDSTGTHFVGTPSVFGLDFQSVSVGQKLAVSGYGDPAGLVGGYLDANATPGNALTGQLAYVDNMLGIFAHALRLRGLSASTLVIVSAKHGQSPIDRTVRVALDDGPYDGFAGHGFHIADDESLIWLQPQTRTASLAGAKAYLQANAGKLGIQLLLDPDSLKTIYQDPAHDSRTPDFIAVSRHGVIYTSGTKLAEHGGFSYDDRSVAMLVSAPGLVPTINYSNVLTQQIAPTILGVLGLNPALLDGVKAEGTQVLPF